MSGGFFRGTSADQDTRFSNKQAKLLKSQKFASELDHLVDITKVKMDVMRPWITNRVTELLGFEDEVLINFIFGLLDGKGVNGKEVQIQLTGFMEKNTGKFMKELWALLLSAQNNASGVPQQLLDAKEEETRKKKAETDRIANEIQKKKEKEGRELEQEKLRKMDGENDTSRANDAGLDTILKHQSRASSAHPTNENESSERNGSRGRGRVSRSPHSADRSPSPLRHAPSRSVSKSFSNSRSYSNERNKSRSITRSPQPRRRSISSERVSHSPPRRSVSPRKRLSPQRSPSPLRRRSSHSRRRSTSRTRRSPSPVRRRLRSPLRRRSRSPIRRRSRPPFMRRSRSPTRRRSPSPIRRRSPPSPMRRRSPSPMRRRSPSPVRRRSPSPVRRRVLSPIRRRSPSPVQRRSPSPVRRRYRRSPSTPPRRFVSPFRRRSPFRGRRRSPTPSRHRSPSPREWSSQSPVRRTSPSPVRRKSPQLQRRSPVQSPRERERERMRQHGKFSPVRHAPLRDNVEDPVDSRKGMDSVSRRPPVSLMSPQRDPSVRNNSREKVPSSSPSPYRSPPRSESPLEARKRSTREDRSPYESPLKHTIQSPSRKPREHKPLRDNLGAPSVEEEDTVYAREHGGQKHKPVEKRFSLSSTADERKDAVEMANYKDEYSLEKLPSRRSRETRSHTDSLERRKNDQEMKSERTSGKKLHPEVPDQPQLPIINEADGKNRSHSDNVKDTRRNLKSETLLKSTRKVDKNDRSGSLDSISEESDKQIAEVSEKRKHKRSEKKQMASDDDYSSDSPIEGRKESKRRRKEEKRVRKEEKRRRREERRRKREYRRAEKLKMKSIDTVTPPSDLEKSRDGYASDGEHFTRKDSRASDTEKAESEQKKLEIELREKALESLRAKKGVGH